MSWIHIGDSKAILIGSDESGSLSRLARYAERSMMTRKSGPTAILTEEVWHNLADCNRPPILNTSTFSSISTSAGWPTAFSRCSTSAQCHRTDRYAVVLARALSTSNTASTSYFIRLYIALRSRKPALVAIAPGSDRRALHRRRGFRMTNRET